MAKYVFEYTKSTLECTLQVYQILEYNVTNKKILLVCISTFVIVIKTFRLINFLESMVALVKS